MTTHSEPQQEQSARLHHTGRRRPAVVVMVMGMGMVVMVMVAAAVVDGEDGVM